MKVFEVIYEKIEDEKVITTQEFVTQSDDDLSEVARSYDAYCHEAGHDLISVKYVVTICRNID